MIPSASSAAPPPLPLPLLAHKGNVKQRVKCAMSLIRCACAPLTARSLRPVPTRSAAISLRQLPLIAFVSRVIPFPFPLGDQDGDSGSGSPTLLSPLSLRLIERERFVDITVLCTLPRYYVKTQIVETPTQRSRFVFWQEGAITSAIPEVHCSWPPRSLGVVRGADL